MSERTGIEWCDHTFNPWWGCTHVSPGCRNCYAEARAKRLAINCWGSSNGRKPNGPSYWSEPYRWHKQALKDGLPHRVFCASMCDVFEDSKDAVIKHARPQLWRVIKDTPKLTWLLLTKRAANLPLLVPGGVLAALQAEVDGNWLKDPPANVAYGVSVEDQEHAFSRLPHLVKMPARCRFVSVEPLLGPVNLRDFLRCQVCSTRQPDGVLGHGCHACDYTGLAIHWVIVGGESGRGARPCHAEWINDLVMQCRIFGVKVFTKQLGSNAFTRNFSPQAPHYRDVPHVGNHPRGGDPDEWPAHVHCIREFPTL